MRLILFVFLALAGRPADAATRATVCGTIEAMSRLTASPKAVVAFQRPTLAHAVLSPSGRFAVHYATTGTNAVSLTDADGSGVPDYVEDVAEVFDEVWSREVDDLGYNPPPSDGDGIYDVYIRDLSTIGRYGITYPVRSGRTSPSYIEIENDFAGPGYLTRGLDAIRFTAAHEFFHAVQFGYYISTAAAWWHELTATWMQDEIYPGINDHIDFVNFFLAFPEASMYEAPPLTGQPYGAMVLGIFLSDLFGKESIRASWEVLAARLPQQYALADTDAGIPGGFASVLPRFWIWNYFTGSRARSGRYYAQAGSYGAAGVWSVTPINGLTLGGAAQVEPLGATYARINTSGRAGGLRVAFDFAPSAEWHTDVLLVEESGHEVLRPAGATVTIPDAGRFLEVVFIPSVVSLEGQAHAVSYSVDMSVAIGAASDLVADFDANGDVGFPDFVALAQSFGRSASEHAQEHDLDGDGRVDFADFVIFARHFGESR